MSNNVKLFYYNAEANFGDMLNVYILRNLFGIDVEYKNVAHCNMVAIGSLLQMFMTKHHYIAKYFKPKVNVWGTGFICPETDGRRYLRRRLRIYAVRGQLTLNRLRKYTGNSLQHVVLGDPGLLASRLICAKHIKKKYDLGIIPHYVDKESPWLANIKIKNSVVIDIQQNPITFLQRVAECKNIISSAMHGLIAADSLGVPNARMILSDNICGGDYKYNDYYSAFGITEHNKIYLSTQVFDDAQLALIEKNYQITPSMVNDICDALIRAFVVINRH